MLTLKIGAALTIVTIALTEAMAESTDATISLARSVSEEEEANAQLKAAFTRVTTHCVAVQTVHNSQNREKERARQDSNQRPTD